MNAKTHLILSLVAMTIALGAAAPEPLQPSQQAAAGGASIRGGVAVDAGLGQADLSRVIVYLDSDPALDAVPAPQDHYTVGQQNKAFVPNFIAVPRNSRVEFPNWDHFDHNVFSRSAAAPSFDLQRYGCCMANSRTFDKVGVVQIFCNIHPFMRAHVIVTPNKYAAQTKPDGTFEIAGVPAGKYTLVAWQERSEEVRQPVEVTAAGVSGISLKLVESKRQINENAGAGSKTSYGVERGVGAKREVLNLPIAGDIHPAIDAPPPGVTPPPGVVLGATTRP